jgi:nicotinamide-nucleotide amidase
MCGIKRFDYYLVIYFNYFCIQNYLYISTMTAATLIIGDEILIGQTADTNSACIAAALSAAGIQITQMRAIADSATAIASALDELLHSADMVILTGGLGPTNDDITKHVLAKYFGAKTMITHAPTLKNIENMAGSAGFEMNELNRSQAQVPDVCQALSNAVGTAPGMWFEHEGKIAIAMPGVPFEMEHILRHEVMPRLQKLTHFNACHNTALVFGIAESMLAKRIAQWETALETCWKLAYLPSPLGIKLRLSKYNSSSHEKSQQEALAKFEVLKNVIPEHFVGIGDHTLEYFVGQALLRGNFTIATAESCTGGRMAALLTKHAGSSAFYKGGVVAYDNAVKTQVLGVEPSVIERCGAVSEQCAMQMALGAQQLLQTDYAIASTGIAGPNGGTTDKPVGRVCIGIAAPAGAWAQTFDFGSRSRQHVMERTAARGLWEAMKAINIK